MLSPCLGRDDVQRALNEAIDESRWVTVVGPPGSGKTLLVRHVAEVAPASWVDARNLRTLDDVLVAALASLESETAPGDSLTGALGRAVDGRDTLLVLDGLDLDATDAGPVLQSVLESTSDARVVVTARTTAGQPYESVVRVGPLPVPTPRSPLEGPAVELFLKRIRSAGGQQVDLAAQAHEVRRLLSATGGLPLLIEQVAVQSALVGLSNAMSTVSLDQAVDSAHDLLDDASATALRRIGLLDFPVGLGVLAEVLELPVPDAAELAGGLVRRSLLEVDHRGHFDMLSPIRGRARALARPGDTRAVDAGLLRWAGANVPEHDNFGAADAAWLRDLPAMRHAVLAACADPATRAEGYSLANRIYSSLYTSMRAREALEILEGAIASGDGPPAIGAQIARRAGIAASEMRGTYEGLWLLDRSDEHASSAPRPEEQLAKTASIRAEMHLDAGDLVSAESEAKRAIALDPEGSMRRQATRTLADVYASQGRFAEATRAAGEAMPARASRDERWIDLSARTVLARIALEQGRIAEAVAGTRAVVVEARELAEDRVGLLAETMLRGLDPTWEPTEVNRDTLPWAVRLPVLAQDGRDLLARGETRQAAGLAADVVALADSARLGRDGVEARLLLGRALVDLGDLDQATTTYLTALEQCRTMRLPLRAADVLDGLAGVARARELPEARALAAAAVALRAPRMAVRWGYSADYDISPGTAPEEWLDGDDLSADALPLITAVFNRPATAPPSALDALTAAERQVADRVAHGLTSRKIAEELFVSPRTVDAHLTHIYRKLDINTRARLAALVMEQSQRAL
ncbi:DNA-binding CsgD family transcriptional regulator/tetratricopeptide (TPR) repeat protein/energy-coupling factor transporter ATP-binding protein EcfA2 [Nocardioides sp. BE266]|uniref:LuxR C-terminal-related transcriptional regulator n=1 Tax=Nocardioides sp. BE266 TaxID=2817725 RepID=UPI002859D90F|nr:LuxR C-terminal-related transcriptional regulator [Nocardioides sp. BE266]MDR7251168.1 DNA-binding CsgD family transcriptional regulator/tetratricopeptide (TPR) repeat protein/energy-coupling factor transporter ATP-binding protein EcfA2 [Nocardioides sp. BE266]